MSSPPPPPLDLSPPQGIGARLRQVPGFLIAKLRRYPPEFRLLLSVEVFTGDRIGPLGRTPLHVTAWRELLNHHKATNCFKSLIARATLPGQLYGLAGLYFTDPVCLKVLAAPYFKRQDAVYTIVTCVAGNVPADVIVERIVDGTWPEALRGGRPGVRPPWPWPSRVETHTHYNDAP